MGSREWAKEGVAVDWQKLLPPKGFVVLPRRWVVERTLSWIDQQRRMSKDYERSCASGEAFVYAGDSPHGEAARSCLRTFQTVSEKLFGKSERGRSMMYAPEHGKALFDRSFRRRTIVAVLGVLTSAMYACKRIASIVCPGASASAGHRL